MRMYSVIGIAAVSLLMVMLPACSSTNSASTKPKYVLSNDLAYGPNPAQRLDIYAPPNADNAPIIFMVHGGAWRFGDKAANAVVENKVSRWVGKGFVFISVNYRLLPETGPREQVVDIVSALKFVQANIASRGGDPTKIILMGHSAGAHLVSVLSASKVILDDPELKPWLATISLDTAAFDIEKLMNRKHLRLYDRAFGDDPEDWRAVSPSALLEKSGKPMLLICSTIRRDKPCNDAEQFAQKAKSLGMRVELLKVAMSHRDINAELGADGVYTER